LPILAEMDFLTKILEPNVTRSVLAIMAIVVTLILYRLNRKRKDLSYRVIAKTRLIDVDSEIGGRVRVLLDGEPVGNVGLVQMEVENTGNEPIRAEDSRSAAGSYATADCVARGAGGWDTRAGWVTPRYRRRRGGCSRRLRFPWIAPGCSLVRRLP
jgi:hypothetical protein